MYGAILEAIIVSSYEFDMGDKRKEFPLFSDRSEFTNDTVMTLSVAERTQEQIRQRLVETMQRFDNRITN